MCNRQDVFRQRRSTDYLLAQVSSVLVGRNPGETHLLSLDIFKGFDQIGHKGLVLRLYTFGFPPTLVSWTSSIPDKQTISIDGILSQSFLVNPSVSQGSVVAPCFLLTIYPVHSILLLTCHPPTFVFLPHSLPCEKEHPAQPQSCQCITEFWS